MLKKLGLTALVAVIGLGLISYTKAGRKAGSLVEYAWTKVVGKADQAVPLEWEIDRLGNEIEKLKGDISGSYKQLAKEIVEVDRISKDIKGTEKALTSRLDELKVMKKDLDSGATVLVYGGREFKADRVREKFSADWQSYKNAEGTLASKKKLLEKRQEFVENAEAKIKNMTSMQDQLRTKLAQLKADLEAVKLAQAQSPVQVDDSRLADIKTDMGNLESRLAELKKETELQGQFANDPIPVGAKVEQAKAEEEFDSRFGPKEKVAKEK